MDYVASLLDVDAGDVLQSLARVTGVSPERCAQRLRHLAFRFFHERSRQRQGYPRLHVVEGYQAAGLTLSLQLRRGNRSSGRDCAGRAVPGHSSGQCRTTPTGFPGLMQDSALLRYSRSFDVVPELRKCLWPDEALEDRKNFRTAFRRQEQRRELLSAMARLGASYIDLYLLAIARIGSFKLGQRRETDVSDRTGGGFCRSAQKPER